MRVYYYGVFDTPAGLENFAKNLITSVTHKRDDIKFTILAVTETIAYKEYFLNLGCDIIFLPNYRKHPFAFYNKLLEIFKNSDPEDVVQANICSYRNYFLFKACKKAKMNLIVVGHYTKVGDNKMPWLHYYTRNAFKNLGVKVTNSDEVTKFMFSKKSSPVFIYNGIDSNKFAFSETNRNEMRTTYNVRSDDILIGQIGRIATDKNQSFSIKVFKEINSLYPNTKLFLIGKEIEPHVRKEIGNLGLENSVFMLGVSKEPIEKWYSAFDISLLPSIHEGLSLSLLENVSNGVPLILSTGVPFLNIDPANSFYLDLDVKKWVEQINNIISCKLWTKRKNDLKNTVYDITKFADAYIDIYLNYSKYKKDNK